MAVLVDKQGLIQAYMMNFCYNPGYAKTS